MDIQNTLFIDSLGLFLVGAYMIYLALQASFLEMSEKFRTPRVKIAR